MNIIRLNTKIITNLSHILAIAPTDIMNKSNIAYTTYYRIMQNPGNISIQQLLALSNGLHIPVRIFFSTEATDTIGWDDDYITEPYEPCYYDETKLLELIDSHKENTWEKAVEKTGVGYQNLRNSLLAVRRTPVVRFLTVCNAFGADPFTILIDPNKIVKKRTANANGAGSQQNTDIHNEVSRLRKDVDSLSRNVDDLTKKYRKLFNEYKELTKRFTKQLNDYTEKEDDGRGSR